MTAERGSTRRALPWIALALLVTTVIVLWRGGRAPDDDALAPGTPSAPLVKVAADELLPARPVAPPREAPPAAPEAKSRKRSRSGPSVPAPPAQLLTGHTVDEERRPLGGVHVELAWLLGKRRAGESSIRHDCVSDDEGRFAVETFDGPSNDLTVSAWRGEFDLLEASPFERDASGRWLPVELVLAREARLAITVLDAAGAPVRAHGVMVTSPPVERPSLRAGAARLEPRHMSGSARTDANGRVERPVGPRRLLQIRLEHDPMHVLDRVLGDELVAGSSGEPLLLEPGERLELVVRLGRSLVVEGTVAHADGTPVDDGRIRLFDGDPSLIGFAESRAELELEAEGRFRFELHDLVADVQLAVLAVDGWWFGLRGNRELRGVVWREVRLEEAIDGVITLALVVEPLLELQGRVLDADGAHFPGTVWAVPTGSEYLLQKGPHGLLSISMLDTDEGGAFTIDGLLPGEYDIVVKRGAPRTYHRFDGYSAGERGIELRIEDDREVAIRLSFVGGEQGMRIQPVLLTHHFRRPSEHPRVTTPTTVTVEGCERARWPTHEGPWSVEGPVGRTISLVGEERRANEHRFEPQQAGWYSVGARAWDAADRPYLRRLSEPVWLERGEHEFVVELTPTTQLVGTAQPGEHVEVRDAAGERVPRTADAPFAQADGRGAFRFEEVPVGALRVRAGTLAELERGLARLELAAHARRGEQLSLSLE